MRLSTGPGGGKAEFLRLEFPEKKEDIEDFIVRGFLTTVSSQGILPDALESLERNQLDDFDFTVTTHSGPKYIELMEIAPLEHLGGSYNNTPGSYKPYDLASHIMNKIVGKSNHYTSSTDTRLILLLYVTHWFFKLGENTLSLLRYWTLQTRHCFDDIYYYSPTSKDSGQAETIFPTSRDRWIEFDPEKHRAVEAFPFDPTTLQTDVE